MPTRALVTTAVAAAFLTTSLTAPAAVAKHRKPLSGSYALTLPVPFPAENSAGSHCADAPDGLSRDARTLKLPSTGRLKVTVAGHAGDWVVELHDRRGRMLTSAGGVTTPGGVVTLSYRKKTRTTDPITVLVCNYAGGPTGNVAWTFVFD